MGDKPWRDMPDIPGYKKRAEFNISDRIFVIGCSDDYRLIISTGNLFGSETIGFLDSDPIKAFQFIEAAAFRKYGEKFNPKSFGAVLIPNPKESDNG